MGTIFIYWLFSSIWNMGIEVYHNHGILTFKKIFISLLFGWFIMPMCYGSSRGKALDK
jgi:hypothetical protein